MALIAGTNKSEIIDADDGVTSAADTIYGLNGFDTIYGLGGDDVIEGGLDGDSIDGGDGHDTASYATSSAVSVSLIVGAVNSGGDAEGDVLLHIENLIGSAEGDTLRGDDHANSLSGGRGDDSIDGRDSATLDGAFGTDTYLGGDGNDTIVCSGSFGRTSIDGGIGADSIDGAGKENFVHGGDGADTIYGGDFGDTIDGGADADIIHGLGDDDYISDRNGAELNVISGDAGDDTIDVSGSTAGDSIDGGSGADEIYSGRGADTIVAGDDDDFILIAGGADSIDGGDGVDSLYLALGSDAVRVDLGAGTIVLDGATATVTGVEVVVGGDHADTLIGSGADEALYGGFGDDTISGGAGADTINAGAGRDSLDGGAGAHDLVSFDVFYGVDVGVSASLVTGIALAEGGNEAIFSNFEDLEGSQFEDTLTGDGSANHIYGGDQSDLLSGGAGNDTLDADAFSAGNVLETGDDTLIGGAGSDLLRGGDGIDTASYVGSATGVAVDLSVGTGTAGDALGDSLQSIENLVGSSYADTLAGDDGANTLDGGSGADSLAGGDGDDVYVLDATGEKVVEQAGEGTDLVRSAHSFTLGANLENLTLTGSGAVNATGNGLANHLIGNAGANVLNGSAGADTMEGGAGNDTYVVDNVGDVVKEAGGGVDLVQSSHSFSLAGQALENLTLTGTGAINGTGNSYANVITGNTGANLLDGSTGADTLVGGAGDDTYVVDNAGDVVTESGGGTDLVRASVDFSLAGKPLENLMLTGTAAHGTGNSYANALTGNSSANVLDGGLANDTLTGGAGHDYFLFSTALGSANVDKITDFVVADDTIRLGHGVFTGLATGPLSSAAFHIGAAAADSTDRIIYDDATGQLLFDDDGTGKHAATAFATIGAHLALTSADFQVV